MFFSHFITQSPGNALILVANLVPPISNMFELNIAGSPSAWVIGSGNFTYANAPTITSVRPNYVMCTRTPTLIVKGSNATVTHKCPATEIDVNGCGYSVEVGLSSYCSFYGNSSLLRSDGSKIWNAPYTRGQVTSNQQIRCSAPEATRSSCVQNSSFTIGSRHFGISQIPDLSTTCEADSYLLNSASWFPLFGDTQVSFTFYDDPAYLNFKDSTALSPDFKGSPSKLALSLDFLRVSLPISKCLCLIFRSFPSSIHRVCDAFFSPHNVSKHHLWIR